MSNYPSVEQVCNLALAHIGEWQIEDIYKDSQIERLCRLHLPQVRRSLLRLHPWNFAIRRVELPYSTQENVFGFTRRYSLPSDYLQLLTLSGDKEGCQRIDRFKVEGQAVLCDSPRAFLEYVADVSCSEFWSTDFIECVTYKLAARLANPLGAGRGKAGEMMQQLEQLVLSRSLTNNAWEDQSAENNPLEEMISNSNYVNQNRTPI